MLPRWIGWTLYYSIHHVLMCSYDTIKENLTWTNQAPLDQGGKYIRNIPYLLGWLASYEKTLMVCRCYGRSISKNGEQEAYFCRCISFVAISRNAQAPLRTCNSTTPPFLFPRTCTCNLAFEDIFESEQK